MTATLLEKRLWPLLSRVPKGRVTTYGALASALRTSPRAVGRLLNRNPYAPRIPCHRVVMSDGLIGGYATGVKEKVKLLRKEGVIIKSGKVLNFENLLFEYD